jgi:hypothetical protein
MPGDNENDIEDVEADHDSAFPQSKAAISQEDKTEAGGNSKERDVSHETSFCNLERLGDGHAS